LSSNSTFLSSTSNSYALALYELSKENSTLDVVVENMKSINKLLTENINLKEAILNPIVTKEDKKNIILLVAEKSGFSEVSKKFLGFVAMKNRLFFLSKIIDSFLNLESLNRGELKAKLISSKELSAEEQKKITSELSSGFKSSLNVNYKYNPKLIAGLIIQVGSVMVDTSIKTKLKKLEKNMLEA
tara:strand:- start:25 stop:582 length:558 start_codon:yes stop_codon:yes gene_type:complete